MKPTPPKAQAKAKPKPKPPAKKKAPAKLPAKPKPKPKRQPRGAAVETSKEKIEAIQNRTKAMELRLLGMKFREIGAAMGFTEQRAHQLVTEGLAAYAEQYTETARELFQLDLQRLDQMFALTYQRATYQPPRQPGQPYTPPEIDFQAVHASVRIMERRAKMVGYDSPRKLDLTNGDGTFQRPPVIIEVIGVRANYADDDLATPE